MSITSILNIAKNALSASQISLRTTSHNIANVDTPGYARQEAVLDEAPPVPTAIGLMGDGARVRQVIRYYDKYLENMIAKKDTTLEEQQVRGKYFERIEGLLNEDNSKLSQYITDFFNGWHDLSTDPQSVSAREGVVANAGNLARSIRNIYADLKTTQLELNNDVSQEVDDINRITTSIASLNQLVFESKAGESEANDYMNNRTELLKELSGKLDLVSFEDKYGRLSVLTSGGRVLVDGSMSWDLATSVNGSTGMTDVQWKDSMGNLTDIGNDIQAGKLAAVIDMRDVQIPNFISNMDDLAQALIQNVNAIHSTGVNLQGTTNIPFFGDIHGNYAKDIDVSSQIKADTRLVAATSSLANPADNDIALALAALSDTAICDGNTATASQYATSLISRIGELTKGAKDAVTYNEDTMRILEQQRESVSGVSLDDEMASLIKFQQAFQAAARLFNVADELFKSILEAVK